MTSGGKERAISVDERYLVDLAQGRRSLQYFFQGRFTEEDHPLVVRRFLDLRGRTAVEDHGADAVGEVEQLVDRLPSVEAGAVALQAARSFEERVIEVL